MKMSNTERVILPVNTEENFLRKIPPYYRRSNNLQKFSKVFLEDVQSLFDVINFFRDNYNVNATGHLLDLFGSNFLVYRTQGETDNNYRSRIIEKIILTRYSGTKNELLNIIDYLLKPRYRNIIDHYRQVSYTIIVDNIVNYNGLQTLKNITTVGVSNQLLFSLKTENNTNSHGFFLSIQFIDEFLIDINIDNNPLDLYNIDIVRTNDNNLELLVVGQESILFDKRTESRLDVQDDEESDNLLIKGDNLFIQYEEEK